MGGQRLPNLFLVGAEKSGTSFLAFYLSQHEEIFFPIIKEPQFFSKDVFPQYPEEKILWNLPPSKWSKYRHIAYIRDINLYLKLYDNASEQKYLADASVSYLYSKVAASEIFRFNPDSKILIILRHPIDRAFSAYKMDLTIGRVTLPFNEAIKIESRYLERGFYYQQVKRYYDNFGKDKVMVMLFDDLKKDPQKLFDNIFSFLCIRRKKYDTFDKVNESLSPKSKTLNYFLYKSGLKFFISKYFPQKLKNRLKRFYYTKNFLDIEPKLYNALLDMYQEDILRLSKLIGRDLSRWLERR